MERLGRGVVAVNRGGGKVYVGWRLLGTDPAGIAFNLYRTPAGAAPRKLNAVPVRDSTNFVDAGAPPDRDVSYSVRPVANGRERGPGPLRSRRARRRGSTLKPR